MRSRGALAVGVLALTACLSGCEGTLTEIIVVVDSELTVPAELDEIVVTAEGASGQPQGASAQLSGGSAATLPVTVGLRPGANQNGPVAIYVHGRRAGVERVAAHVSTHFAAGQRLVLRIDLVAECVGIICGDGETCRRGLCVAALVDPAELPRFTGTLPGMVDDAGVADAGISDAGADAMRTDASLGCILDTECADGDACNGAEYCDAGVCLPGTPMACDDGVGCTVDSCAASACAHTANDALCTATPGGHCDLATGCQYPTCTSTTCASDGCTDATCSSTTCVRSSRCTGGSMCCGGACVAAGCDDGNPCTSDSCGASGCVNTANAGAACSDGDVCTMGDSCDGSGACRGGVSVACNDGNACTDDSCSPSGGCVFAANTAPCDDGSACTGPDRCSGGSCAGGPRLGCDDGNPCTADGCNPSSGCVFPVFDGPCDDGNVCTTGETCSAGACGGGVAPVCPPATLDCERAVCLPSIGCTTEIALGLVCDDYDNCTRRDRCLADGSCMGTPYTPCTPL